MSAAPPASGEGIFNGVSPLTQTISLFFVQATIIIGLSNFFGLAGHYLKSPKVIFEIIAGIILGPSALCRDHWFAGAVFPPASIPYLQLVANIGLTFYLFIIGIELDTKLLMTHASKTAGIALCGMVVPFCLGIAISRTLIDNLQWDIDTSYTSFFVFIGTAMSITAFPVLARILKEGGLIYTKPGAMTLGAAALNDAIAWCLLALSIAVANGGNMNDTGYIFAVIVGFALFQLFVIKPFMEYLVEYAESNNVTLITNNLFAFTICMLFMSAWFTELIGLDTIFGAFIFGLTIPRGSRLYRQCREYIEEFVLTFTLPLYFTISGLKTDITTINSGAQGGMIVLVCVIATFGKIIGAGIPALLMGNTPRESATIATLMNTRGLVELIVLNVGLSAKILNTRTFSVMVIMCLFTTFITSPIVAYIYPVEKRKQLHAEVEGEDLQGVELVEKEFHELKQVASPTITNHIAVVIGHLPYMQPVIQALSYFLPHSMGSKLSVTAMHFIEATKTHRDEFLGLNPEGRLIRVDEETTDFFQAFKLMEDPAAKKPELLPISVFCKANSVPVNAFRIEGDAIEYPAEMKSIAASNDCSLIMIPFRSKNTLFRHLFWTSLHNTPAPVILVLQVNSQKVGSERDVAEAAHSTRRRSRTGSFFVPPTNYESVERTDEEGHNEAPLFSSLPPQVLPLHRRGSVTNHFQKIAEHGLEQREVVMLLTGRQADLIVLSLLPRLSENSLNKIIVCLPKDHASFNNAILDALQNAKNFVQGKDNVVFETMDSISTDYEGLYNDVNEKNYDLLVCSFIEPPRMTVEQSSRAVNRGQRSNTVLEMFSPNNPAEDLELRLQSGMPTPYAYSDLGYPMLGMIGSKIYEGNHLRSSLVWIVHEGLKMQGRASIVSERTDLSHDVPRNAEVVELEKV